MTRTIEWWLSDRAKKDKAIDGQQCSTGAVNRCIGARLPLYIGGSFNGRTRDFDSRNLCSIHRPLANSVGDSVSEGGAHECTRG